MSQEINQDGMGQSVSAGGEKNVDRRTSAKDEQSVDRGISVTGAETSVEKVSVAGEGAGPGRKSPVAAEETGSGRRAYVRTIEQMMEDPRDKCLIDVRSQEEFAKDTIEGAGNIFWEEVIERREELPLDRPVYLLCYSGEHSEEVARDLSALGYEIYSIEHGYQAYIRYQLSRFMEEEDRVADRTREIERSLIKKFKKDIWCKFTRAIREYDMIQDGDKIAVCISGGKDSMIMAKLFQELLRHGKQNFSLEFLLMNPGYNEENYRRITDNARLLGIPIRVFESSIYDIVAGEEIENPCYLCARMRRGHLYAKARELGCNKIALGHHFDDVIETILMGMLYGGQIQTMMPKVHSTNFQGMELIRPLYLVREADIIHWARYNDLRFILCACRLTDSCSVVGGAETGSKRAEIKALIRELKKTNPYVEKNIFRSVENVNLRTVIAYKEQGVKHSFLDWYEKAGRPDSEPCRPDSES